MIALVLPRASTPSAARDAGLGAPSTPPHILSGGRGGAPSAVEGGSWIDRPQERRSPRFDGLSAGSEAGFRSRSCPHPERSEGRSPERSRRMGPRQRVLGDGGPNSVLSPRMYPASASAPEVCPTWASRATAASISDGSSSSNASIKACQESPASPIAAARNQAAQTRVG